MLLRNAYGDPLRRNGSAAIDDENLPGDEIGLREVGDGAGDVFGAAGALQGRAANEILRESGSVVGKRNRAGSDGVHANLGSECAGKCAREHDHASF
jgi:hypothetical protein